MKKMKQLGEDWLKKKKKIFDSKDDFIGIAN